MKTEELRRAYKDAVSRRAKTFTIKDADGEEYELLLECAYYLLEFLDSNNIVEFTPKRK